MVERDVRWAVAEFYGVGFRDAVVVGEYCAETLLGRRLWHVPTIAEVPQFWTEYKPAGPYVVVALDFEMKGAQAEADAMVELCHGADRLVLEWETEYEHPVFPPSFLVNRRKMVVDALLDIPNIRGGCRTLQVWD